MQHTKPKYKNIDDFPKRDFQNWNFQSEINPIFLADTYKTIMNKMLLLLSLFRIFSAWVIYYFSLQKKNSRAGSDYIGKWLVNEHHDRVILLLYITFGEGAGEAVIVPCSFPLQLRRSHNNKTNTGQHWNNLWIDPLTRIKKKIMLYARITNSANIESSVSALPGLAWHLTGKLPTTEEGGRMKVGRRGEG